MRAFSLAARRILSPHAPRSSGAGPDAVSSTSRAMLILGVALAGASGLLLLGFLLWSDYRHDVRTAEATTRNYAAIIEARLEATLRRLQSDLEELSAAIPVAALRPAAVPAYEAAIRPILLRHVANFPEIAGLRITDASGERLYTTDPPGTPAVHSSDRSYFRLLRAQPDLPFVFSEVIIGRVIHRMVVVMAKAIRGPNGTFRGTVFAALDLSALQGLFQSLDSDAASTFALYRSDNYTQVLRWPPTPSKLNVALPVDSPMRTRLAGAASIVTLDVHCFSDGVTRIYSLHRLTRYPFFVATGVSRDDIFAKWKARVAYVAAAALFVGALVIALVHRLRRAENALVRLNSELERRVRERTAELENANRELEAFSYSISHDLRAPLRSIASYSRLLSLDHAASVGDDGKAMLARVEAAAHKMGALIEDLLRLSRITRSQMKIEAVNLAQIARSIAADLTARAPQREVDFDIAQQLDARGDAALLTVALENLMENAWKFTGTRQHAHIRVGAVRLDGELLYFVRDNGVGFDMAHASSLFAPFQRLHRESEFPGTGIGLATVKRVVQRHGGHIRAEAAPGVGATFYFTLHANGGADG